MIKHTLIFIITLSVAYSEIVEEFNVESNYKLFAREDSNKDGILTTSEFVEGAISSFTSLVCST